MVTNPKATTTKVEHLYRDFSQVPAEEAVADQARLPVGTGEQPPQPPSPFSDGNFPVKLHFIISELEADGMSHIISWQPHGRCFLVQKQQEFVERILPLWFRQTKFASFQRQLNIYGFSRITVGPDKNAYYHEYFLRGKPFLSHRIQRMEVKGNGPRKAGSAKTEPDFYTMRVLPGTSSIATKGKEEQQVNQWAVSHQNFGPGGFAFDRVSLHASSTPPMLFASAMQAFSQSHGFPSDEGSLACLALRLAAARQRNPIPPPPHATLPHALALLRQQGMAHSGGVSLSELDNRARAMVLQSIVGGYRATSDVNTSLAFVQRFIHQSQNGTARE